MTMMTMKTCTKCNEEKALSEFHKNKCKKDGLQYTCKACVCAYKEAYHTANREKIAEKQKRYYTENRAVVLEKQRQYREKNHEKIAEYRVVNREVILEQRNAYREGNREVILEQRKRWYEANREKIAEYRKANPQIDGTANALSRSPLTETELFAGLSRAEANAEVRFDYILRDLLTEKTGVQYHVDHIKPICEGGVHRMWNLAVVTDQVNLTKGPIWFCEDHLTDEDIEAADAAALQEVHDASTVC